MNTHINLSPISPFPFPLGGTFPLRVCWQGQKQTPLIFARKSPEGVSQTVRRRYLRANARFPPSSWFPCDSSSRSAWVFPVHFVHGFASRYSRRHETALRIYQCEEIGAPRLAILWLLDRNSRAQRELQGLHTRVGRARFGGARIFDKTI